jgi:hypothetical protein
LRYRKPVNENIVMLKRLSEAISQSNIKGNPLASEIHCSHHSSCNFHPKHNHSLSAREYFALLASFA